MDWLWNAPHAKYARENCWGKVAYLPNWLRYAVLWWTLHVFWEWTFQPLHILGETSKRGSELKSSHSDYVMQGAIVWSSTGKEKEEKWKNIKFRTRALSDEFKWVPERRVQVQICQQETTTSLLFCNVWTPKENQDGFQTSVSGEKLLEKLPAYLKRAEMKSSLPLDVPQSVIVKLSEISKESWDDDSDEHERQNDDYLLGENSLLISTDVTPYVYEKPTYFPSSMFKTDQCISTDAK